jgi:hypothetical protein
MSAGDQVIKRSSDQAPISEKLTLGSFEILGILKEAMVATLARQRTVAGLLLFTFLRQRLSGEKLPRRLVAIAVREIEMANGCEVKLKDIDEARQSLVI